MIDVCYLCKIGISNDAKEVVMTRLELSRKCQQSANSGYRYYYWGARWNINDLMPC
jgi:hypothetical protein